MQEIRKETMRDRMMPLDFAHYYPFEDEVKIPAWQVLKHDENGFLLQSEFTSDGGDFWLLVNMPGVWEGKHVPRVTSLTVNGDTYDLFQDAAPDFIAPGSVRFGVRVRLKQGSNLLLAEGQGDCDDPSRIIQVSVIPPLSEVPVPRAFSFRFIQEEKPIPDEAEGNGIPDGFTPGVGCSRIPGRFGFTKGDGMLDCAMPTLGNIDKMYLCGDPRYRKPFRWNYSTLPEGAPRHGSYCPANCGIENDKIDVEYLSVHWETQFGKVHYGCSYSLASPGIITESDADKMRISDLEHAGNYQYVMIPREGNELEVSTLREWKDFSMGANWLLFFGCTEFPDLPLMVVLEKQPETIAFRFAEKTGRLSEICFHGCRRMISCTPFGIESFEPIAGTDRAFLKRAAERCRFWSRALLAHPKKCCEYYRHDEEKQRVTILQKFSYRILSDAWNTKPLRIAPLPPVLTLSGIMQTENDADFAFPTKYGEFRGRFGSVSEYSIPWMECRRKFPLRDVRTAPSAVRGMADYFRMISAFPVSMQSYPYAGSLLEGIALPTTLMNFMTPEEQQTLRRMAVERLPLSLDPDRKYLYPVIHHGKFMKEMPSDRRVVELFNDPALEKKVLCNWYSRREPFTGATYQICYLNLYFLTNHTIETGSREEVLETRTPLIENDWGVGLTFYYLYLASLAAGDFRAVKAQWPLLKSVFSFFEKMHDWACMGTGYSDNAILWVEGANYGAFTSFVNMAEAVGDAEALSVGRYLGAKQQALRFAVVRSAQHYFCRYYQVEPWQLSKIFAEESSPYWQHQGVPVKLKQDRFRMAGIYNLTTEGIYPELFASLRQELPQESEVIMTKLRNMLHELPENTENNWNVMQGASSMLTDMALNDAVPMENLSLEIEFSRRQNTLMTAWRGIHIYTRRLPENYFETQLLAWNAMKGHPFWMEHWQDLCILRADWTGECAEIEIKCKEHPVLCLGCRRGVNSATWNGETISLKEENGHVVVFPPGDGTLRIW